MKPSIIASAFSFLIPILAWAGAEGSNGGRGGIPSKIDEAAIAQFILDGGLRASLLNYLDTIDFTTVQNEEAKRILRRMMKDSLLQKDIQSPENYRTQLEDCRGANSPVGDVLAWTQTGKDGVPNIGGLVCFDVRGLVTQFSASGIGIEEAVLKIAALAFHEHTHHFQDESADPSVIEQQEKEANEVAGYVELTARVAQVPLLVFAPNAPVLIEGRYYADQFPAKKGIWCPMEVVNVSTRGFQISQGGKGTRCPDASFYNFVCSPSGCDAQQSVCTMHILDPSTIEARCKGASMPARVILKRAKKFKSTEWECLETQESMLQQLPEAIAAVDLPQLRVSIAVSRDERHPICDLSRASAWRGEQLGKFACPSSITSKQQTFKNEREKFEFILKDVPRTESGTYAGIAKITWDYPGQPSVKRTHQFSCTVKSLNYE